MKLIKLSVMTLAMGLVLASCGDKGAEGAKTGTDSATAMPATPPPPPPAAEPAKTDSAAMAAAKDTTKPADTKMDKKDTKMEAKKK